MPSRRCCTPRDHGNGGRRADGEFIHILGNLYIIRFGLALMAEPVDLDRVAQDAESMLRRFAEKGYKSLRGRRCTGCPTRTSCTADWMRHSACCAERCNVRVREGSRRGSSSGPWRRPTTTLPFAAALTEGAYDLAFVDPPYGSRMLDRVIDHWMASGFARVLAVEHERTHDLPAGTWRREFDDTAVTVYCSAGDTRGPQAV